MRTGLSEGFFSHVTKEILELASAVSVIRVQGSYAMACALRLRRAVNVTIHILGD